MSSLRLAVFDLDGTLVELEYEHFFEQVREIFPKLGVVIPDDFENLARNRKLFAVTDVEDREEFENEFWRNFDQDTRPPARMIPSAVETIKELVELGFEIAIATARTETEERVLKYLEPPGISEHISVLSTFRDRGWTEKTEQLLIICQNLKISPKEAFMAGDTPGDIYSAASAGYQYGFAVLSGEYTKEDLMVAKPHGVFEHVGEILPVIRRYG